ncbi:MAG TPA: HEPN domain-containing protein [Phycisphaerae bacterium]|nr:HEPN domain-containing protein [Phycisphaerae bacterium]
MTNDETAVLIRHRLDQAQIALDDAKFLLDASRSTYSVVNRAYYAMFYAVLALLQSIGRVPSKHAGAISLFDTEFASKGILPLELSKDLHKAFEVRQLSDYRAVEPVSPEKAEEILNKSVRFVHAVRTYLLGPHAPGKS